MAQHPWHRPAALAVGLVLAAALAGCEGYTPKPRVSSIEDCRDCLPGLFSGEDGVLTLYGPGDDDLFGGGTGRPAAAPAPRPATSVVREEYETIIRPDGTVIERKVVIHGDGRVERSQGGTAAEDPEAAAILARPLPHPYPKSE